MVLTLRTLRTLPYLATLAVGFVGGTGAVVTERLIARPPTLAAVDLTRLIAERATNADVARLADADRQTDARQFAQHLEDEVKRLAHEHGAVLAECADHVDVLLVAVAAFDEPDVAGAGARLEVADR